jgi:LAS superfamily LD-carboxypeptidase LdcB
MSQLTFSIALILFFCCCSYATPEHTIASSNNEKASSLKVNLKSDTLKPKAELDSLISKDFLMGKFNYKTHPWFVKVPTGMSNREIYIQKETLEAFSKMHEAAKKDGINFVIISGTRNFTDQKAIWENKWSREILTHKTPKATALKILEYSSMPSTSRHHWGTDIDINSLVSSYFKTGKGAEEYAWLVKNAKKYGFYQTYTPKDKGRTGYAVEEWHWSYFPLSHKYLEQYNLKISNKDIVGFTGCETAAEIDIVKNYVNGIELYE